MSDIKLNLQARILEVMKEVKYLQTDKQPDGLNFRPTSRRKVVAEVRPALIKHGICVMPGRCINLSVTPFTNDKGKQMFITSVNQEYIVSNVDDPSQNFICSIAASGCDNREMGSAKALTVTEKQLFINLFHIEIGDEDLPVKEDDEESVNAEEAAELEALAKKAGVTPGNVASAYGAQDVSGIAKKHFAACKARLEKAVEKAQKKESAVQ